MAWIFSTPTSPSILWLRGPIGTGKTALAHTVAELCKQQGALIGCFFFARTVFNCSNPKLLFPTLASQLVQSIPKIERYVDKAMRQRPHLLSSSLGEQARALLLEPLQHISSVKQMLHKLGGKPYPRLIVIDGLDECSDKRMQADILEILGQATQDLHIPIRFLVASRPEPHISRAITALQTAYPGSSAPPIDLKEDALTRRDIQRYFESKFQEVRQFHPEVPPDWPSANIITQLVNKASGQFIYTTTVMSYILSPYHNPEERLRVILGLLAVPTDEVPYAELDALYVHILRTATHRDVILRIIGLLIVSRATCPPDESVDPRLHHCTLHDTPKSDILCDSDDEELIETPIDLHSAIDSKDEDGYIEIVPTPLSAALPDTRSFDSRTRVPNAHVEGLSIPQIEVILDLKPGDLRRILTDVHSLIESREGDGCIKILHASLPDFLLDKSRSKELFLDLKGAHTLLAREYMKKITELKCKCWSKSCFVIAVADSHTPHQSRPSSHPGGLQTWIRSVSTSLRLPSTVLLLRFLRS